MSRTTTQLAPKKELIAWAMYDFANSGYTTVVLTAIFNAYFVGVIAASVDSSNGGTGTLLWSLSIGAANPLILFPAPVPPIDYACNDEQYNKCSSPRETRLSKVFLAYNP